jgi:two-component system cell cycle sensor histidine kinase/response regulator CckA
MKMVSISNWISQKGSRLRSAAARANLAAGLGGSSRAAVGLAFASGLITLVWVVLAPADRRLIMVGIALVLLALAIAYATLSERWPLLPTTFPVLASLLASVGMWADSGSWALGLIVYCLASMCAAQLGSRRGLALQLIVMSGSFLVVLIVAGNNSRLIAEWLAVTAALIIFGLISLFGRSVVDRLVEDLQARARGQRIVARLGQRALIETDIGALMQEAAEAVVEILSPDLAVIFERFQDTGLLSLHTSAGRLADVVGTASDLTPDAFMQYVLSNDEPTVVTDLANESRFDPPPVLVELGVVSVLGSVIPGREHPWGVLGACSTESRVFGDSEIDFLRSLANLLGSAVEQRSAEETARAMGAKTAELNERLSAMINASPVAIIEIDPDRQITVWNEVAERIFGWSSDEVIGTVLPIVPEDRLEEHNELVARVIKGEQISNHETERLRRDGTLFPFLISMAPHRDAEGEVVGVIGIGTDLSSSKLAEEELLRSRELYRVVVENSHDMIALLDPMGRFVFASPSYEQALGYGPEELVDVSPISLVHPSDVQRASDALRQAVTSRSAAVVELRMRHKRGNWVFVEGTTTSVLDENGQLRSILMSFRDISERRTAEEELREAEARYRLLVEQLPLITYINAPGESGRWVYLSPQLEQILGYKPADWVSEYDNFVNAIHPDDRERVTAERASSGGKGRIALEYRLIAKDERLVWVRDEAVVVRDLSGKPLYVQGYLVDISVERGAEVERQRLEAELLHSQKMEAIGRLAGGIAHDFNNLLTAITGYSELIVAELDPASSLARDAEEIKRAAEQAAAMTQQLLAFSRRQVLQPVLLNPNEVIGRMEKMLQRLIGENIELVTVPATDISMISADRGQIEQVMMNLVVNARDSMPNGGKITIETAKVSLDEADATLLALPPGDFLLATISDTGFGMDEETMSHIFEPFFTTKGQGEGTGLGLATVHGIVEQSNGAIRVASALGEGSVFRVYLPVAAESAEEERPVAPLEEARGTETILLVEDEEMVRQLVARVLRDLGYEVLETSSGDEAILLSDSLDRSIDLLVTDVVMPGMSGREVAEVLAVKRPTTRVLFMSGYTDEAIVRHGVLDGVAEFIGKPFTPQELARKIRSVLEGSESGEARKQPASG